ncbi:hypothetical protein PGT21_033555 [Puccinia graminis f. sp. tritici]|nr:hypothetical protein PGTUg99_006183 [Puccinia graminis f. sp. tritici]KAA1084650.1 hypothetical protein PGT21_033555 [Puccinia graminis f. sp. tritici]
MLIFFIQDNLQSYYNKLPPTLVPPFALTFASPKTKSQSIKLSLPENRFPKKQQPYRTRHTMSISLMISKRALQSPVLRSNYPQRIFVSSFSTTPKSNDIVGKVQDAAQTVNKKASELASKGMENLEAASNKVKQATSSASSQARNVAADAKNEANKTKESAKDMAQDAKKKVQV